MNAPYKYIWFKQVINVKTDYIAHKALQYSFTSPTVGCFIVLQQQVDSKNRKGINKKQEGQ